MPFDPYIPRLYTMHCVAGKEREIIKLLYETVVTEPPLAREKDSGFIIPASEEYLFIPEAIFQRKYKDGFHSIRKDLFPGYVFITAPAGIDLYLRIRDFGMGRQYGKQIYLLRNALDPDWDRVKYRDVITPAQVEQTFRYYLAKLTDEEEQGLMSKHR